MTKSTEGSISTVYVYDIFGQLAAEYNNFPKQQSPCTTCYLSYDHLGTVRMVTDAFANIIARHDYLPFGEEIPANAAGRLAEWGPFSDKVNQKFTGQERDDETGFDFFQARYYYGAQGRFNSPDPGNAGADPTNPQSWNGYSYVLNNPLNLVDPGGTVDCTPTDGADFCEEHDEPTPQDPWSPGGSLFQLWWNSLPQMQQVQQQAQHVAQQAFNWLSAQRDPGCMTAHTVAGAGAGMATGAVIGAFGGPADVATLPGVPRRGIWAARPSAGLVDSSLA